MVDYSVLDHFCRKPSWSSFHPRDRRRLGECLSTLMDEPGFDADQAVAYVRAHQTPDHYGLCDEKLELALVRLRDVIDERMRSPRQLPRV